jgi:hypothetical protein
MTIEHVSNRIPWNKGQRMAASIERHSLWRQEGTKAAESGDPLHLMATMLYWAEGGKANMQFTNTSVEMHRIIVAFLRKYFPDKRIKLGINYYKTGELTYTQIQDYWMAELGLSRDDFIRPTERERYYSRGDKVLPSPYGVARIYCYSRQVLCHLQGAADYYLQQIGSSGGS